MLPSGNSLPRFRTWALVVVVFGLVLLCYWPALHGVLLWDDPAHVPRAELQSWHGLARIWTDVYATQQYYPVLFSAFWFEHQLWGDATLGYHLVNVLLHASSCCFLALILRRLWQPTSALEKKQSGLVPEGAEWIAALLMSVHPVCVESVAWITEQKNTLSLFFYLLAALSYLAFTRRRTAGLYATATFLFLLALGSKTSTVTLPAALLVIAWWQRGRIAWRRDVLPLLPWFAASASIGLLTSWVERKVIGAEGAAFDLSWLERGLLAGRMVWFYLGKLVWPHPLMFFYPRWSVPSVSLIGIGSLVAVFLGTGLLWILSKRSRGPLAAWLLFVGGLFPVLGFFNVFFFQFSYVNDHFVYLASLAPLALAAAGMAVGLEKLSGWNLHGGRLGCVCLLAVLAVQSHRQSALYRSNETLMKASLALNPDSWMAHHILGFSLAKAPDRQAEAMIHYEEAIRLNPDYPDAHHGLAVELARLPGRQAEAMAQYEWALRLRPYYAEAHYGLATLLTQQPGKSAEVITHLEAALAVRPDFVDARIRLADSLARQADRRAEAIGQYEQVLRLRPDLARVHCDLAHCLAQTPGREAEAIGHFETAMRLQPTMTEPHNGLAILYARRGQLALAKTQWEEALRIDPGYETARRNLQLLEQARQGR